jgi:hypothetical protein
MKNIQYLDRMPYLSSNKRATVEVSPGGIPYNSEIPIFNRKMQVVIPTHGRPKRQFTLKSLSKDIRQEVLVVTSLKSDAVEIQAEYGHLLKDPKNQVISLEEFHGKKSLAEINFIAKKRQWLIENLGSTSVFQMDCDQYFFARCPLKYRQLSYEHSSQGSWELKPEWKGKTVGGKEIKLLGTANCTQEILTEAFRKIQDKMTRKEGRSVHTGMSSRMGNNQVPEEEWREPGRAMHSIGHRRDALIKNNIRFDEVRLREDFLVTLRLLSLGYINSVYYHVCSSPSDYGAKGGCSDERTVELANSQADLLASKFPGLVKVHDKKYSHSGDRKEVLIFWERTYQLGLAKQQLASKASIF